MVSAGVVYNNYVNENDEETVEHQDESGFGVDENSSGDPFGEDESLVFVDDKDGDDSAVMSGDSGEEKEEQVDFNNDVKAPDDNTNTYLQSDQEVQQPQQPTDQQQQIEPIHQQPLKQQLQQPLQTTTVSVSKNVADRAERDFKNRLGKIKLIPSSKFIDSISVKEQQISNKSVQSQQSPASLSIKFIIKPLIDASEATSKTLNQSALTDADEGSGKRDDISTVVVKDGEASGSGSGYDGTEVSGSGDQELVQTDDTDSQKVLTFTLKAVSHPLRLKNETSSSKAKHVIAPASLKHPKAVLRPYYKKISKKAFVPEQEMDLAGKQETVQTPSLLQNLFYTSLNADFHSKPEFGSNYDPWSNADIQSLQKMASTALQENKEPNKQDFTSRSNFGQPSRITNNEQMNAMMYRDQQSYLGKIGKSTELEESAEITNLKTPSAEPVIGDVVGKFSKPVTGDGMESEMSKMGTSSMFGERLPHDRKMFHIKDAHDFKSSIEGFANEELQKLEQQKVASKNNVFVGEMPASSVQTNSPQADSASMMTLPEHLPTDQEALGARLKAENDDIKRMADAEMNYKEMESKTIQNEMANRKQYLGSPELPSNVNANVRSTSRHASGAAAKKGKVRSQSKEHKHHR